MLSEFSETTKQVRVEFSAREAKEVLERLDAYISTDAENGLVDEVLIVLSYEIRKAIRDLELLNKEEDNG